MLRKNFVLIDFESVQPESIDALSQDHFNVLFFIGANQTKISLDLVLAIQKMGARADYVKMSGNGPNALDFHIAFYIGQISIKDPTAYFHIISKDKGFDPLIQHLKTKRIYAARSESISDMPIIKNATPKTPKDRAQLFIVKLQEPKTTRPRTTKALIGSIKSYFHGLVTEEEILPIIEAMHDIGFISTKEEKIVYDQKIIN